MHGRGASEMVIERDMCEGGTLDAYKRRWMLEEQGAAHQPTSGQRDFTYPYYCLKLGIR